MNDKIDLEALDSFSAVAKFMSFTKAADYLRISQSTLSRHVKTLEKSLDTNLFIRNSHEVRLTEAGKVLLRCSESIQVSITSLRHQVSLVTAGKRGQLSIGMPNLSCPGLFRTCSVFCERYPEIQLSIQTVPLSGTFDLIRDDSLDIVCALSYDLPEKLDEFRVFSAQKGTFGIIARKDTYLMSKYPEQIPMSMLKNETVYGFPSGTSAYKFITSNINNQKYLSDFEQMFHHMEHKNMSVESLLMQGKANLGLVFLPYALYAFYNMNLMGFRRIAGLDTSHEVLLLCRKNLENPAVDLFLKTFQSQLTSEFETPFGPY